MRIMRMSSILLLVSVLALSAVASAQDEISAPIADPLALQIQADLARKNVAGEALGARQALLSFYEPRGFAPAFIRGDKPTKEARKFREAIAAVTVEGLKPEFYHAAAIDRLWQALEEGSAQERTELLAELDLLLSDAFFLMGAHFSEGLIDPYRNRAKPFRLPADVDLVGIFRESVAEQKDTGEVLRTLLPKNGGYAGLRAELDRLRGVTVVWPTVPQLARGDKIEPDQADARLVAIRRRLEATGELDGGKSRPPQKKKEKAAPAETAIDPETIHDEDLVEAVKRFQRTHGLNVDGVIGRGTTEAMNVPVEKRIEALVINMDRVRAMSRAFAEPLYIFVDVPAFEVKVFENGSQQLEMKAIVGRIDRKSPIMSNRVRFLVFSPKWRVPRSIAIKDKLPILRKDPDYLRRAGMTLYTSEGERGETVDPTTVDWSQVDASNFDYRIVQRPGGGNALGRVKFIFPNQHDVYLHDTEKPYLFKNQRRTLSSGCIRISKPKELAQFLLRDQEGWDLDRIEKAMFSERVKVQNLTAPVPIHIAYFTAWFESGEGVRYFHDIYGRDRFPKKILMNEGRGTTASSTR